ncbi:tail fiber protein; host specificity [Anabaena phage A-4L]|uniref:Tail protein n=1 Tax=Anabaena phage A-4L TaxID=1357732 RepID=A0A059PYE1_9CAUD|nr:tail fiber protein; host specificity [Anabaena phage A-4L]AGR48553.1 tail protein [Anabaena phage A-4L]
MSKHCGLEANQKATDNEPKKRIRWNKSQRTLIEKLTADKHRKLRQSRRTADIYGDEVSAAQSQKLAEIEEVLIRSAGDVISLDRGQYDKWASLVSAKLGWRRGNPLNPSLNYSQAGEVREALKDARRVAQNLINDASHIRMLDGIKRFDDIYRQIMKPLGMTTDDARALFNETIEIGSIPKNNKIYGNSEGVRLINSLRHSDYIERAKGYGLNDEAIETLLRAATDVHSVFDEMRVIAEATGHNIEELQNLGYFPRIATRDFNIRLRKALETDTALADVIMSEGVEQVKALNPLSSVWQKSRKFNYFVPDDLEVASKLLNTSSDEIAEMLLNPREWMEFLTSSVSSSQIETMTELGVMSKLPMTSREVFEQLVDQYELPYKHINEMFKLDPHVAAEEYARVLRQAVGNSAMLKTVVKDGLAAGWAVPEKMLKDLSPKERANFVPLSFQKLDQFMSPEQLEAAGKVYVHRVVSDQWRSMLEISMSANKLGAFASAWSHLSTFLNKSVLASRNVLYVGTNFLSGFVLTNAVGANVFTVPHAMMDISNYLAKGLDAFDGTKPFAKIGGEWISKREFFKQFLLKRGSDITPGTVSTTSSGGDANPFTSFKSIGALADVRSAKRALEYLWSYSSSFGDPVRGTKGAAEYVGSLLNEATDNFFSPFAKMASFLDTMYKWNAYTSLVERQGAAELANTIAQGMTLEPISRIGRKFDNWRDLSRHIDDYFFTFDDPGTTTKVISKYVRPFANWSMQSTPAMLRAALRSPQKFSAYAKLLQLYNRGNNDDEPLNQSQLTDWQDDEYPVILQRDALQTGDGNGGLLVLFPHTFDPITDTLNVIDNAGRTVNILFGNKYGGNERDNRNSVTGKKDGLTSMLTELFNDTYWAKPAGLLLGIDSFTGQKIDASKYNNYLGFEMHPLAEALLGMYTPLDAINRTNLFDTFGRREYKDYRDRTVVEEKPGLFGGQRTNSDAQSLAWETAVKNGNWSALALMTMGARVRLIDTARNTQMTLDEIKTGIDELQKANVNAARQLTLNPEKLSESERNKRTERLTESLTAEYQMKYDYARLINYMKAKRIPPKRLLFEMQQRSVNVSDLEPVGGKQRLQLESDFRRRIEEINK